MSIVLIVSNCGIFTLPFSVAGHTRSWGYGQPGLLTRCYSGGNVTGDFGPIDPTRVENFNFLRQLFTEVAGLFPDYYLHLGGDEVPFGCWSVIVILSIYFPLIVIKRLF